ncbi:hypothetical protein HNY73_011604, partial [Argiope bruennichi]
MVNRPRHPPGLQLVGSHRMVIAAPLQGMDPLEDSLGSEKPT